VNDAVSASSFTNDIDNQGVGNYKYDKTGNLIEDVSESIRIHWTYYNKVKQIDSVKLTPPKYGLVWATKLRMKYDALGNRVVKENPKRKIKEVYVRDVQGNVIALYEVKQDSLYSKEFYMYGSNRLGYLEDEVFLGRKCIGKFCNVLTPVLPMFPSTLSNSVSVVFGKKRYELSDWLGNVRVVINDRKTPINSGVATVGYKAQVVSVSDYYSFGSEIGERTYDPVKPFYRFGFNTQEKTFELNRDHYTAKFWEYDARLGRRWNVDPKPTVGISDYVVFLNNPIINTDWLGDSLIKIIFKNHGGLIRGMNYVIVDKEIADKVIDLFSYAIKNKIPVSINSSFRTTEKQTSIQSSGITPASPGNSPHEIGFGIDLNIYGEDNKIISRKIYGIEKTKNKLEEHKFVRYAKELGFRWGGDFKKIDEVHFDLWGNEKSKFRYNSKKEAYEENQSLYKKGIMDIKYVDYKEEMKKGSKSNN
jgi:hypothetical protein